MIKWFRLLTIIVALIFMAAGVFILDAQKEMKLADRAYEHRDMDQAMRHARRATRSGKKDKKLISRALNLQYTIAIRRGHPEKAIDYLDQAILVDPRCGLCYLRRGDLEYKQDDFVAALYDFEKGFENISFIKPAMKAYYYARQGLSHLAVGETQKALQDARTALPLDPESPLVFFLQAKIQDNLGNLKGAYENAVDAYRLGQKNTSFFSSAEGDVWLRYYADVMVRYRGAHR
jgi:tetratricopeptide (TPR) repeat protein